MRLFNPHSQRSTDSRRVGTHSVPVRETEHVHVGGRGVGFPPAVIARRVGDEGFVEYLHRLQGFGILDHEELIAWLQLHGVVLRGTLRPLDDGTGVDEEELDALGRELGGELGRPNA